MSSSSAASSSSSFPPTREMNLFKLTKILLDHDRCIQWCKEHNLLASSFPCPNSTCCNTLRWTRRSSSRDGYEWRCSKKNCNGMASIRQNSWFSGSKLSTEKIITLTYAWANNFTTSQAVHETSTETVVDWYHYCREVCAERIMQHHKGANRWTWYYCWDWWVQV